MKRKHFTEEQIVGILRDVQQEGKTVAEVCRAHGVSEASYYRWRRRFEGLSVPELRRLRDVERENTRLKRLVAERDLEIDAMKEVLAKNW